MGDFQMLPKRLAHLFKWILEVFGRSLALKNTDFGNEPKLAQKQDQILNQGQFWS